MADNTGSANQKPENDFENNRVDTTTGELNYKAPNLSDNRYFRRHIDAAFQQHGSQLPDKVINSHYVDKFKRSEVEKYINDLATKSEECVYEKMKDCTDFVQVTNWSELMHSAGLKETCNHELALAMKTIANTERFPEPKKANGVNFKLLYLNLSNMMLGHPIQQMNSATKKLLKDLYEENLNQIRQTDNSENIALIRDRLRTIHPARESSAENICYENLDTYFNDTNLNPLQIPFEKLFYVSK
ncbi:uncharacterized protein LOC129770243 [Toxorhynchites rutilus septentrionalis]|uniref:uncharacterized protein LOC129770243 n=1 Tax=Toxorhynchites rutilus septentrionalis TaxID=329112 RepID=UPI00247AFB18|nr:uncharacterized protein LOC129770243 [Toxorhynchites rutilus septentrionalis]